MLMRKWRVICEAVCLCLVRLRAKWPCMDSFFWSTINTVEAERSKDRTEEAFAPLPAEARTNLLIEVCHECVLRSGEPA